MKQVILCFVLLAIFSGCSQKKDGTEDLNLPYPPDEDMIYYQAECDSGTQTFWKDIKAAASAYLNNSRYASFDIAGDDIIILGEGLFHGQVEVEIPDSVLIITLERKFKSRGKDGIWQVIAVASTPWPKTSK